MIRGSGIDPSLPPRVLSVGCRHVLVPSFQQECRLSEMRFGTPSPPIVLAYVLQGLLDIDALKVALREIVRRHDALRMWWPNGLNACATVSAVGSAAWPLDELDFRSHVDPLGDARHRLTLLASQRIDVTTRPSVAGFIARVGQGEWCLGLALDHLVFDGISVRLLLDELCELYSAAIQRRSPCLPEPGSYEEYASDQSRWWHEADGGSRPHYWKKEIADSGGYPPGLVIPFFPWLDTARPQEASVIEVEFPFARSQLRRPGTTPYALTLSALLHALRTISGSDRVAVATSAAGRDWPGSEHALGLFTYTAPIAATSASPAAVLAEVRDKALALLTSSMPPRLLTRELQADSRRARRAVTIYFALGEQDVPLPVLLGVSCVAFATPPLSARIWPWEIYVHVIPGDDQLRTRILFVSDGGGVRRRLLSDAAQELGVALRELLAYDAESIRS